MSLLYVCFFFFKQKTAYEMRISDWSSDVCSSDLVRLEAFVVLAHDDQVDVVVQAADAGIGAGRAHVGKEIEVLAQDRMRVDRLRQLQIGRASCRERVCQYV